MFRADYMSFKQRLIVIVDINNSISAYKEIYFRTN